jgi:ComF family protein
LPNSLYNALQKAALGLLNQVIPPTCLLCSAPHSNDIALICGACRDDLPYISHPCYQCALPLPAASANTTVCGQCLQQPPPFKRCLVPLSYAMPIDSLIAAFKYRNQLTNGRLLSQLLLTEIGRHYADQPLPEIILPVPLHWRRQWRRGYNQSQCVASYLGAQLSIPVQLRRIRRIRLTPSQQGLNKPQRQRNLKQAFSVTKPFTGETIALIDDVMTTGATCTEISRELLKAGAGEVHIWALARTPVRH